MPRRQVALRVEVAGVHLGVNESTFAEPVEEHQGVARAALVPFQERHAYRHVQLAGQLAERADEVAVHVNRLGRPVLDGPADPILDGPAVQRVPVAPHLREQGDIRPKLRGTAAGLDAFGQIAGQRAGRADLQQCDGQWSRHDVVSQTYA